MSTREIKILIFWYIGIVLLPIWSIVLSLFLNR